MIKKLLSKFKKKLEIPKKLDYRLFGLIKQGINLNNLNNGFIYNFCFLTFMIVEMGDISGERIPVSGLNNFTKEDVFIPKGIY